MATSSSSSHLLAGNRRALARAISQVEDQTPAAHDLLAALYPAHRPRPHRRRHRRAGHGQVDAGQRAGARLPGAGKTVGIIAVDPTSPFSGGALLGDRVRMRDLAGDPGVFIRSMATRGSLGGLARATADVLTVLDAAGFDRILVETVGVGQAEIDIASAAHTTIVVEAPGLGDEVQAIKAGVLEIADVFAVNKADREGADHTVMALQMMQGLAPSTAGPPPAVRRPPAATPSPAHRADGGWLPPIVKTVAMRGGGRRGASWTGSSSTGSTCAETGQLGRREEARAASELDHILRDRLLAELTGRLPPGHLAACCRRVARRRDATRIRPSIRLLAEYGSDRLVTAA